MTNQQMAFPWEAPAPATHSEDEPPVWTRRIRGYQIYCAGGVSSKYRRPEWTVASQKTEGAFYRVRKSVGRLVCNCPDFSDRCERCKHIWAVLFQTDSTERANPPQVPRNIRPAKRDWKTYNATKPWVETSVARLLAELARMIDDPPPRRGNQPAPIAELLFASVMRLYVDESGRDFCGTVLQRWVTEGYLSQLYHFNTLSAFMRRPAVTLLLRELIRLTSRPIANLPEATKLAVDSTGFSTSSSSTWYDHKFGRTAKRGYIKLHVAVETLTHIITDAFVTDHAGADSLQLPRLLAGTGHVRFTEVSADKAYAGKPNYDAIERFGALPFIPPRAGMTGKGSALMAQIFHGFRSEDPDVLRRYHRRSNVETVPFMIKTQFGDDVAAKDFVGQTNEILGKALCHNLHALTMTCAEFNIAPHFFGNPAITELLGA